MERISIIVKTNAKKTEIVKKENDVYYVNVKAEPEKGKANVEVVKLFSKKFGKVKIVSGLTSRKKVLKIE